MTDLLCDFCLFVRYADLKLSNYIIQPTLTLRPLCPLSNIQKNFLIVTTFTFNTIKLKWDVVKNIR